MEFRVLMVIALACTLVVHSAAPRLAAAASQNVDTTDTPADQAAVSEEVEEPQDEQEPPRLIDREPFDRVTLDAANENQVIETLLLDLPDRTIPNPLPRSGRLQLYRVNQPSVEYEVVWSSIASIELYEQMVLAEAARLSAAEDFSSAFEYYAYLQKNYSQLPGLAAAMGRYLYQDALFSFQGENYDLSLITLAALLDHDPAYANLAAAVETVADKQIRQFLAKKEYAAARESLQLLQSTFSQLPLKNVPLWHERFRAAAGKQVDAARTAIQEKQYSQARTLLQLAREILPSIEGAASLQNQLQQLHPEIVVGVARHAPTGRSTRLAGWAEIRTSRLVDPLLVELIGFGTEGGIYQSRLAKLERDNSGLELSLQISSQAVDNGITPGQTVREMLALADPNHANYQSDFADLLHSVTTTGGQRVLLQLNRAHVRPEPLLHIGLRSFPHYSASNESNNASRASIRQAAIFTSTAIDQSQDELEPSSLRFQRQGPTPPGTKGPHSIVEQRYANDDLAVEALRRGRIDLLDRVPPWHLDTLRNDKQIIVGQYRLPTVHVLRINRSNPLLNRHEFRRALCYGIDRKRLVRELLLGDQDLPGFQAMTGPLPVGTSHNDPIGYGYLHALQLRPYEPRLAALLASLARTTTKRQPSASASTADQAPEQEKPADQDPVPLVLGYSADPIALVACQAIKAQLSPLDIPVELKEIVAEVPFDPSDDSEPAKYDLIYTELAIWEPVVDARRLLGPNGIAGHCTDSMSLALDELGHADHWKEAREKLHIVHRIAYHDLPVIPLWQTYNYYAHHFSLHGMGDSPITCYQNAIDWRISDDPAEK
jgi:peptide/nickel transport system substrate-binding protein